MGFSLENAGGINTKRENVEQLGDKALVAIRKKVFVKVYYILQD